MAAILDADITTPSADTTECILEKLNSVLYSTAVADTNKSFWVWKQGGRPADRTHSAVTDMKRMKRSLRSKQRQLKAQQQDAKHLEIMCHQLTHGDMERIF